MVDIVSEYWNHLEHWVFENYELLKSEGKKEMGVVR